MKRYNTNCYAIDKDMQNHRRWVLKLTACGLQKRSEFSAVCGIIVVKRKITAELAVIFLKMVDLIGIEPTTLRMRTVRSPSWAIGPYCRFLQAFCNKKRIFKFFDFRRFRRKFSPKSWAETRRSMCDHRDANRTLSQLSYRPKYKIVWLQYMGFALPAELQAHMNRAAHPAHLLYTFPGGLQAFSSPAGKNPV